MYRKISKELLNINIKRNDNNSVLFKDLVDGEVFKFFGIYYLKINSNSFKAAYCNCVSIADGVLKCLAETDLVESVKGSFVEE